LNGKAQNRQARQAFASFRDGLQDALACVWSAWLVSPGPFPLGRDHPLDVSSPRAELGRDRRFSMRFALRYRLVTTGNGTWSVETTAYSYWLEDEDQQELLLFQWVPNGSSPVRSPHLHIGALAHRSLPPDLRQRFGLLAGAHLPTGYITVAEVLAMAIRDLGIEALRDDYEGRLAHADAVQRRSLPGGG